MDLLAPIRPYLTGIAIGVILLLATGVAGEGWWITRQAGQLASYRAADANWRKAQSAWARAVQRRDAALAANARREADSLATFNRLSAGDVSSAFQKGLAAGRAIEHAASASPSAPAAADPAAGGVRDLRQAWSLGAYRPGG